MKKCSSRFYVSFVCAALFVSVFAVADSETSGPRQNGDELKAASGPSETSKGVLFSFERTDAGTVSVAGSFNSWDMDKNPMKRNKNGLWTALIPLPQGPIEYKFVVNKKDWIHDPMNPSKIEDSYGGGFKSTFSIKTGVRPAGILVEGNQVTFRFYAADAKSVSVAGSFNEWKVDDHPMTKDGDGFWTLSIRFINGRYQYKYVVNGDQWLADPGNSKTADDGFGGSNSVVEIP